MKNLSEANERSRARDPDAVRTTSGRDYPKREQFFAVKFLRLLTKSAAAMEVGSEGFTLLMIIAGQEDACRYTRPVNFWNGQLATLCGIPAHNESQFRRVRDRCVKAGWLHYDSLGRRRYGRYFVVIPQHVNQDNDGICDEGASSYVRQSGANPASCVRQVGADDAPTMRQECAECAPSIPSPIPTPSPEEAHHAGFAMVISSLKASNAAYDSKALGEWITWLTDDVGADFDGEGAEVIRWATHEAKERGVEVRYARHLAKPDWTKACTTHLKDWRRLQKGAA